MAQLNSPNTPQYQIQTSSETSRDTSPLSVGQWFLTLIILSIPLLNIIMLLVWAFSRGSNLNRSNFAKAQLLGFIIVIAIFVLISILSGLGLMGTENY